MTAAALSSCGGSTSGGNATSENSSSNNPTGCSFAQGTCHLLDIQSPQDGDIVGSSVLIEGTCEEDFDIVIENSHLAGNPFEIQCSSGGVFGGVFSETISFLSGINGNERLDFSVRDSNGELIPVGSIQLIVDQTAPAAPSISNPIEGSTFNTINPTVTGTCQGEIINVTGAHLTSNPVVGSCLFGFFNVSVSFVSGTEGLQTLSVTSLDSLGNESAPAVVTFTLDTSASSVTVNQTPGQLDPTHVLPIQFDVVFDEAVVPATFTTADILQSGTATGISWQITNTGNDKKFKLKAVAITGNGTLIPSVIGGAVQDAAGNQNASSTSTDNVITYDTVVPTVTLEQSIAQADPVGFTPIEFDVVFSEPIVVATFTASDITQIGTATGITWEIINSGDNQNFTVRALSIEFSGSVAPSILAGAIQDLAGNNNLASTSLDNVVTFDASGTTVTIDQSATQNDPVNVTPIEFTVVFSDIIDPSTFTSGDITQTGTATGITWEIINTGDNQNFIVNATDIAGDGTLIPIIDSNTVQDFLGNGNSLSTSTDHSVTYDMTQPSVTIEQSLSQFDPTNDLPVQFDIVFSEAIDPSTFTTDDITQTGSAVAVSWSLINTGDNQHFTLTANAAGSDGTIGPTIADGAVQDVIGNGNIFSMSLDNNVTYDHENPSIPSCDSLSGDATPTKSDTVTWTGSTDALTGIQHYEMSIGIATPADTVSWTSVGSLVAPYQFTSLSPNLLFNTSYTTYIRSIDNAGNISEVEACSPWNLKSGYGLFQGTHTHAASNSTYINPSSEAALEYSTHSFNAQYFTHSSDSHQVIVKEAGDYLLSSVIPVERLNGNATSDVASFSSMVKINGTPVAAGFSANSFTRGFNGLSDSPTQSSNHMTVLLQNLSVDDVITVEVVNNASASEPLTVSSGRTFSTSLEYIPQEQNIFSATATATTDGTDLNPAAPANISWSESINDSGFTHSDASNSENIVLSAAGDYLVSFNVPFTGNVENAKSGVTLLIDGSNMNEGSVTADSSAFISNLNSQTTTSANYTNILHNVSAGSVLNLQVQQLGGAGTLTTFGKVASIYIQKLDTSADYYISSGTSPADWNTGSPTTLSWSDDHVVDPSIFTHSDAENIMIESDGTYMLYFSDYNSSADAYVNPIVNVLINGVALSAGICSAHHQLDTPVSLQSASCNLQTMMTLSAGDVISISTQRDVTAGTMTGFAPRLSLRKIN